MIDIGLHVLLTDNGRQRNCIAAVYGDTGRRGHRESVELWDLKASSDSRANLTLVGDTPSDLT